MQGIWVQSLVQELRSHMPYGAVKKKKRAAISDQISDFQHLEDILTPTAVQTGYKLLQEYVHSCLP